jgi:hypothetical protein
MIAYDVIGSSVFAPEEGKSRGGVFPAFEYGPSELAVFLPGMLKMRRVHIASRKGMIAKM